MTQVCYTMPDVDRLSVKTSGRDRTQNVMARRRMGHKLRLKRIPSLAARFIAWRCKGGRV